MPSCDVTKQSILCKEKLLTDRMIPPKAMSSWTEYIGNHSEDRRLAAVVSHGDEELCKLTSSMLGRDAVVGKESFFNVPTWWAFDDIERGLLLAHSVERLRQAGLVNYFTKLYSILHLKKEEDDVHNGMIYTFGGGINNRVTPPVTFDDSLLRESHYLLLYGTAVAFLWFFGEVAAHHRRSPKQFGRLSPPDPWFRNCWAA